MALRAKTGNRHGGAALRAKTGNGHHYFKECIMRQHSRQKKEKGIIIERVIKVDNQRIYILTERTALPCRHKLRRLSPPTLSAVIQTDR